MLTPEEKMEKVEEAMSQIYAINNILTDAILYAEASSECDYMILLEIQKNAIRNITNLF